jgi:hypothetical protein
MKLQLRTVFFCRKLVPGPVGPNEIYYRFCDVVATRKLRSGT